MTSHQHHLMDFVDDIVKEEWKRNRDVDAMFYGPMDINRFLAAVRNFKSVTVVTPW